MKTKRTHRGFTLIETITAAALTTSVLIVGVSVFMYTMQAWLTGQGAIDAQGGAQRAVRNMSLDLSEAMAVTVDPNGMGVTYRLPEVDGTGAYILPVTWDGVTRRIQFNADKTISLNDGVNTQTLATNVTTSDPLSPGGTSTYQIFTPGAGAITRSMTLMVVTTKNGYETSKVTGRSRETIYLRNIPQLSN